MPQMKTLSSRNHRAITVGLAALFLLGTGCAIYTKGAPAAGVAHMDLAPYGCTVAQVEAEADSLKAATGQDRFVPRVGMSACDVLAAIGIPDRQTHVETAAGSSVTWEYVMPINDVKSVTLQHGAKGWVASTVVW